MSGNKDVMVWLLDNGSNGYGLAVLVKGGSAHSQSEMAHPWYLSRVSSPQWGSSLEYAVVKPDLYGIPSTGRFRAVDGLSCGTWKSGQLSLLGSGHMYGYLTDENDNQADVLYGQMGSGKKMAGIWTGDDFGLQTVTILMDPPQGWQAPDMNCTDDDGGNSTDGGGGGGGGCVMDPEASGGGTWALAGMLLLIFLISRRNLLN
jgi:hypothetical protein